LKQPASGGEGNRTPNVRKTPLEYAQITFTSRKKFTYNSILFDTAAQIKELDMKRRRFGGVARGLSSRTLLHRLLLGLDADSCRRRCHEYSGNGSANHLHFRRKLLRHGLLIARLIGISFFAAPVVAVIVPNLFPGLKPCCAPLP
jgi:hypothetical protein